MASEIVSVQPPVENVPEASASSPAVSIEEEDLTAKFAALLEKTTEE